MDYSSIESRKFSVNSCIIDDFICLFDDFKGLLKDLEVSICGMSEITIAESFVREISGDRRIASSIEMSFNQMNMNISKLHFINILLSHERIMIFKMTL